MHGFTADTTHFCVGGGVVEKKKKVVQSRDCRMNPSSSSTELNVGHYLAPPPLLISATGLETYLSSLSQQLAQDVHALKQTVKESAQTAHASQLAVEALQRYALDMLTGEMRQRLVDSVERTGVPVDEATAVEELLAQYEKTGKVDNVTMMIAMAQQLLRDNTTLLATVSSNNAEEVRLGQLEGVVHEHISTVTAQIARLQRVTDSLSLWLGIRVDEGTPQHEASAGEDGQRRGVAGKGPSDTAVEEVLAQSPLLLALRRFLLRDLSERVTHATDVQSKDAGKFVSSLKDELHDRASVEQVREMLGRHDGVVNGVDSRLRDVEATCVRRDELAVLMRGRFPGDAPRDEGGASGNIAQRVRDLEERLAYVETERNELRDLVRFLASKQSLGNQLTPMNTADSVLGAFCSPTRTKLRDVLATVSADPCDPRASTVAATTTTAKQDGRPIYRVLGTSRAAFATPKPIPSASTPPPLQRAASEGERTAAPQDDLLDTAAAAEVGRVEKVAIGMTANQAAYAAYVTGELNRSQIEQLPPLPYERRSR